MEENYNELYKHLHTKYKDLEERHFLSQYKIKGLHTCIFDLEAKIKDCKALDNKEK